MEKSFLYASAEELHRELLDWWSRYDLLPEGFYGRVGADNRPVIEAPRGLILGARLLWTYAESCRVTGREDYRQKARMLYDYLKKTFVDPVYGGAYYTVSWDGKPEDIEKVTYANAFLVYAFSAYYRLTSDEEAYREAYRIYEFIEAHALLKDCGGYIEACLRDGTPDPERRVTNERPEQVKTMNTSLHVLEAYTGLLRVREDSCVRKSLTAMMKIFMEKIISPATWHQYLFFDRQWKPFDLRESFGHDIEASWLICEAAEVLGDEKLLKAASETACGMVSATLEKGLSPAGLLYTEWDPEKGFKDDHFSWWEQNETVVGAYNAWQLSGKREFLESAEAMMRLIMTYHLDREKGGYYPALKPNLEPVEKREKANMWTCPYHNARMCLELMERIKKERTI